MYTIATISLLLLATLFLIKLFTPTLKQSRQQQYNDLPPFSTIPPHPREPITNDTSSTSTTPQPTIPQTHNYRAKQYLCTYKELQFFHALRKALPNHYIMAKVRLEDVIDTNHLSFYNKRIARNAIKSRHLDFVVCDPNNLTILSAVELDDTSHRRHNRQTSDNIKNAIMKTAGIPLHRFFTQPHYDLATIRQHFSPT